VIHRPFFEYDDADSFLDVPALCSSSLPPSCVPCLPSSWDGSDNPGTCVYVRLSLLQQVFRIRHERVLELPSTFLRWLEKRPIGSFGPAEGDEVGRDGRESMSCVDEVV